MVFIEETLKWKTYRAVSFIRRVHVATTATSPSVKSRWGKSVRHWINGFLGTNGQLLSP